MAYSSEPHTKWIILILFSDDQSLNIVLVEQFKRGNTIICD